VRIYEALGTELKGKVGVKISTGEPGGNNYLHPELIGSFIIIIIKQLQSGRKSL
jgi:hypothetical protein